MKILKIIGIVTALNVLILLMILANPGCSSTSKANDASQSPAPSDQSGITAAPTITYTPEASSTVVYSPTRPGTTAAAALVAQPVDVQAASTYTVARGDSVSSIAKKNHLSASDLAAANNLKSGAILRAGQKLIIPAKAGAPVAASQAAAAPVSEGTRHTVKPGETLGAIARKYGVRLGDIAAANNISDPKKIQPGQELIFIPAKSKAATPPRRPSQRARFPLRPARKSRLPR